MKTDDPRHQVYLEPILRMAYNDIELILSDDFPYEQLAHRLALLRQLLKAPIDKMNEVARKERGDNQEGLAEALLRRDAANLRVNTQLLDRVVNFRETEDDEARLTSFLQGTQHLADANTVQIALDSMHLSARQQAKPEECYICGCAMVEDECPKCGTFLGAFVTSIKERFKP